MTLYTIPGTGYAQQIINAGDGPTMVINRDETNQLYVGDDNSVASKQGTGAIDIIDPLSYIVYDGVSSKFAICAVNAEIQVNTVQGATNWAPSPAQAAAQIAALGLATANNQVTQIGHESNIDSQTAGTDLNTGPLGALGYMGGSIAGAFVGVTGNTIGKEVSAWLAGGAVSSTPGGVPLKNLYNNVINEPSVSLPGASVVTQVGSTVTITQPSIEGTIDLTNAVAGAALSCPVKVWLLWGDISAQPLANDSFVAYPTTNGNGEHTIGFTGPSKGSTLAVYMINTNVTSSNNVDVSFFVNQSSRVFTKFRVRDMYDPLLFGVTPVLPTGIATQNIFANPDVGANILASLGSSSIPATTTQSWFLPLWDGECWLSAGTGSATTDLGITISCPIDPSLQASANIFEAQSNSIGEIPPVEFSLPRAQCLLKVTNSNANARSPTLTIVGVD